MHGCTQYVYLAIGEHLNGILFRAITGKAAMTITVIILLLL